MTRFLFVVPRHLRPSLWTGREARRVSCPRGEGSSPHAEGWFPAANEGMHDRVMDTSAASRLSVHPSMTPLLSGAGVPNGTTPVAHFPPPLIRPGVGSFRSRLAGRSNRHVYRVRRLARPPRRKGVRARECADRRPLAIIQTPAQYPQSTKNSRKTVTSLTPSFSPSNPG